MSCSDHGTCTDAGGEIRCECDAGYHPTAGERECEPERCGDGICAEGTEDVASCGIDCPAVCGDGLCTHDETTCSCADCGGVTCEGDFSIRRAADLVALEGCTRVSGQLEVRGSEVADLAALRCLRDVDGTLSIAYAATLRSLEGIDTLATVGGDLSILANALTSLDGLRGLTSVGENLSIAGNGLTSLGLESMTSVWGAFVVRANRDLDTCAADALLGQLESPPASVCIAGNSTGLCDDVVTGCQ